MSWRGLPAGGTHTQKEVVPKIVFFAIEKSVEDVKQEEKHVLDLLESIMRPTDLVKEELRMILCKMNQFRPKITKIRVCTFEMPGKITGSANVASETVILTPSHASAAPLFAKFGRILKINEAFSAVRRFLP